MKLTVKNVASNYGGQLTANQVATGYEIYVDGIADYINPFVDATGRELYNTSSKKITVELSIGEGRKDVKVYQDNTNLNGTYDDTGVVTFGAQYFTPFKKAQKSTINVVYTKLSEAEKQLNETLGNVTAGDSVSINSTADNMVSVNNIADALNGSSDIALVGNGAANTTVTAQNATITSDSLTVKDMTIQATGTTNTFTECDFQTAVNFMRCGTVNRTLTFYFNDCTYNGADITAANITEHLNFSGVDAVNNITVIVDGVTVTL